MENNDSFSYISAAFFDDYNLRRTATGSILTYLIYGRNRMNDKKRLNSYEDFPLVLDVADIQRTILDKTMLLRYHECNGFWGERQQEAF